MPVGLVEDGPAEDGHVEDDDEAVENREGGHLDGSLNDECGQECIKFIEYEAEDEDKHEDEDGDEDQPQEGCFEVEGGPADDIEGDQVSW